MKKEEEGGGRGRRRRGGGGEEEEEVERRRGRRRRRRSCDGPDLSSWSPAGSFIVRKMAITSPYPRLLRVNE